MPEFFCVNQRAKSCLPGNLTWSDQPVPPPSYPQQPGARRRHLARSPDRIQPGESPALAWITREPPPSVEPAPGRRHIQRFGRCRPTVPLRPVPAGVQQHVGKAAAHLPGGSQNPMVKAALENRSATREHAIHRPREPRSCALHPARQGLTTLRLDQHVDVVALDAVVDDPKLAALAALRPASSQLAKQSLRTESWNVWLHPKCDVHRARAGDGVAPSVCHLGARTTRTAGAGSRSTAAAAHAVVLEGELMGGVRQGL